MTEEQWRRSSSAPAGGTDVEVPLFMWIVSPGAFSTIPRRLRRMGAEIFGA